MGTLYKSTKKRKTIEWRRNEKIITQNAKSRFLYMQQKVFEFAFDIIHACSPRIKETSGRGAARHHLTTNCQLWCWDISDQIRLWTFAWRSFGLQGFLLWLMASNLAECKSILPPPVCKDAGMVWSGVVFFDFRTRLIAFSFCSPSHGMRWSNFWRMTKSVDSHFFPFFSLNFIFFFLVFKMDAANYILLVILRCSPLL